MINKNNIINALQSKNIDVKEFTIRKSNENNLVKDCNGLFYLEVNKWDKIKTRYNYVSIPILVFQDKVLINVALTNGLTNELQVEDTSDDDFIQFKNESQYIFSTEVLNTIEMKYKRGIEVFPKGRLLQ